MKTQSSTQEKELLIGELEKMQQRIAELEAWNSERLQVEEELRILRRFLAIANECAEMSTLLDRFALEIQRITDCSAIGIRILDADDNISYMALRGFSPEFYELECPFSISPANCMCKNVAKGSEYPCLLLYTKGGSFYVNSTTDFLADALEENRGQQLSVCNRAGYESLALVPIYLGEDILGLIHLADPSRNMVTERMLRMVESIAMELGSAIDRVRTTEALRKHRDFLAELVDERTDELRRANIVLQNEITERIQIAEELEKHHTQLEELVEKRTDELRESENKYRQLVENINEGFCIVDENACVKFVNHRVADMLDYNIDEMIGKHISAFMDDKSLEKAMVTMGKLSRGIREQIDLELRRRDGTTLYAVLETSSVTDNSGSFVGYLAAIMDITQRKIMEEQLKQAQKLEAIGQLAAGIAHEINTPIQYIGENTLFLQECFEEISCLCTKQHEILEMAKKGPIPMDIIAEIEKAMDEADMEYVLQEIPMTIGQSMEGIARIAEIVQTIREFSHPGTSTMAPVDINKSIKTTVAVARNEWKYIAEVEMDLDDNLPIVLGMPGELNQAILNLIANAAHAIAEFAGDNPDSKGLISISTKRHDDWGEIRISDTGAGIPEEIRTRIFDPFFTTKDVGKGTGQGLAIVHNIIVEKHGGAIALESEMGKGASFVIRIPINHATENGQEIEPSTKEGGDTE